MNFSFFYPNDVIYFSRLLKVAQYTVKLRVKDRDFPSTLCPGICVASSIVSIVHQNGAYLFKPRLNLHSHIVITQSPQFTRVHSFLIHNFIFLEFWLCWVFVAVQAFLYSRRVRATLQLWCSGLSSWGLLQLLSMGSGAHRLQQLRPVGSSRALEHRLSC